MKHIHYQIAYTYIHNVNNKPHLHNISNAHFINIRNTKITYENTHRQDNYDYIVLVIFISFLIIINKIILQ